MTDAVQIVEAGDSVILAEFPERIDPAINSRCISLAERLRAAAVPGIRDVVPTFRSVAVHFDPLTTDLARVKSALAEAAVRREDLVRSDSTSRRIAVCYGGEFGPDLNEVADHAGLTADEVVAIHTASTYHVFMLGFVPGFAYLGNLDPRIATPRRAMPRPRVPAGSVGIAGFQTAVYPSEIPGGWQLIGRTPCRLFDARSAQPSVLRAGDRVQFFAIEAAEWDRFAS